MPALPAFCRPLKKTRRLLPQAVLYLAKADWFVVTSRRWHQLADCVKDDLEFVVVLALELIKAAREFGVWGEHLAKTNKGSHYLNIYEDSSLTAQYARQHRDALFGECCNPFWEFQIRGCHNLWYPQNFRSRQ